VATSAAASSGWTKFVWAVFLLVAAPIEEFLFRGAMLAGFTGEERIPEKLLCSTPWNRILR
jgi:membrane protease YdiL (CAAX protease family)